MQAVFNLAVFFMLVFHHAVTFSRDLINVILVPDPYDCHQTGVETALTNNSRIGILAVIHCATDRPAYGSANNNVRNNFSRILIPWTFSKAIWTNGYFLKALVGVEEHEFLSAKDSHADVTFTDVSTHLGFQWFWDNGLNVSASFGAAFLFADDVTKNIQNDEGGDVISFMDKNTKSNHHAALGIILGWAF